MVPKVDPPKFPEMLNAITENVRDSYAGMVFIDDPEDLDSWGFTKEQLVHPLAELHQVGHGTSRSRLSASQLISGPFLELRTKPVVHRLLKA